MVENKLISSKIFAVTLLDPKDELDERLEKCNGIVLSLTNNLSDREAVDALQNFILKGPGHHDDAQFGLLYSILTDSKSASKYYNMMAMVSQDGMSKVVLIVGQLIYEKWIKLTEACKLQLTWLAREMIHNGIARADSVCHHLLRQIAGGDVSPKNVWLTETMLEILSENRAWLDRNSTFIPIAVYTYLRMIIDHGAPSLNALRQREVDFCVTLLREKWADCQTIGRDLVRLLQGVARLPEFKELWNDIHTKPSSLSPQFTGLKQLMQMKTSRSYFVSRLTPDMETKVGFLTMQVRFGHQKRYQDWFQRQYLSTPESQSLRCDLIRYICAVIHPTNEVLCSDIIPRWAVIGWLLTTCTSNVAASNAKLALFYDWLFYDSERDNIMNIEPCILVMYNSMRPHPAITATLLDFMCRISSNFFPPMTPCIRQGIYASLNAILEKRVLPSLAPLFNNLKLDKDLYSMLKINFPEFCSPPDSNATTPAILPPLPTTNAVTTTTMTSTTTTPITNVPVNNIPSKPPDTVLNNQINGKENVDEISESTNTDNINNGNNTTTNQQEPLDVAEFSDDEDINNSNAFSKPKTQTPKVTKSELASLQAAPEIKRSLSVPHSSTTSITTRSSNRKQEVVQVDIQTLTSNLEEKLKELVLQLANETDKETQCEIMDGIIQQIIRQDFDEDDAIELSKALCHILGPYFKIKLLPDEIDDESVEESIGMPLFVIFRNIHQTGEEDPSRQTLMMLLEQMYNVQSKVGYYFLYFLKASSKVQHEVKMTAYRDFCKSMENQLDDYLLNDLKLCLEDDVKLFSFLIPDIYSQFPSVAVGNVELLHMIVSSIDGLQLQDLICEVLQGHLVMFSKDSFLSILNASLEWETIEQYFLWQLISSHNIPINLVMPVLPKLDFVAHAEAISSIMILLKQDSPTAEILRPLLCRECKKNDLFTVSLLRFWAQEYGDKLADLLHNQLTRINGTPTKKKIGRTHPSAASKMKDKDQPTIEQILSHLDHMRLTCKDISFLSNESIQQALQTVQTSCSDTLKVKYGDLLALVEDVEESKSTRVLRQVPSRRASQAATKSAGGGVSGSNKLGKRGAPDDSDTSSDTSEDEESLHTSKSKKSKRNLMFED